jgi:hypothetical protein
MKLSSSWGEFASILRAAVDLATSFCAMSNFHAQFASKSSSWGMENLSGKLANETKRNASTRNLPLRLLRAYLPTGFGKFIIFRCCCDNEASLNTTKRKQDDKL